MASVLREFLLAVERAKAPLDDAIETFAHAVNSSPDVDLTKQQQQQQPNLLVTTVLDIHPQCEPFFHVWPDQNGSGTRWEKRESIATFFQVMTVLLHAQMQRREDAAQAMALKIVREKCAHLEKVLTWSDKPLIEFRALELIRTVVSVNAVVAREFVRLFNFQSGSFLKLANRRMKNAETVATTRANEEGEGDGDDEPQRQQQPPFQIREAYVRLVLALTACPDKSVHRFAMKEGGVTSSLFKSIDGDNAELLSYIFAQLKQLVLHNTNIDDKSKMVVFNGHCVHQLIPLLQSEEEKAAQIVLDILNDLFFGQEALYVVSEKQALRIFLSKSTQSSIGAAPSELQDGTTATTSLASQAYAVKMIRNAIIAIGVNEIIRSAHAQTFVLSFITKYPGLLQEYLQALSLQLEPKPVYRWFCVASLVQKLLSSSLEHARVGFPTDKNGDEESAWCSVQILATRFVLPVNWRKELSRGIQHTNNLVIYSCLGVIDAVLRRYQFVASLSCVPTADMENELRFLVPSPETLVALLTKLCGTVQATGLVYVRALTVFRLYMECLPQVMREVKLDFTKILAWKQLDDSSSALDMTAKRSSLQSLIVGEILRFLLIVDANRLPFLLASGGTETSQSKLLQLLRLYATTKSAAVQELCYKVLRRSLLISRVFGRDEDNQPSSGRASAEIAIWLESLRVGGEKCAAFVNELVQVVLADPFLYLTTYRAQVGTENSDNNQQRYLLVLSPAAVALVSFFNSAKAQDVDARKAKQDLSIYRKNAGVVTFSVRVLLSLLYVCEEPQQLVTLIASDWNVKQATDAQPEDAEMSESDSPSSKKRKRQGSKNDKQTSLSTKDGYTWLREYCRTLLCDFLSNSDAKEIPKKAKHATAVQGNQWVKTTEEEAFYAQLMSLEPSTFEYCWKTIVDDAFTITGSFDLVHHYLIAHPNVPLHRMTFNNDSHLTVKKHPKANNDVEQPARQFHSTLPLSLLLQALLLSLSSNEASSDIAKNARKLFEMVQKRANESTLKIHEAVRMCEQLLFFFRCHRTQSHKHQEECERLLYKLLQFLLTTAVIKAQSHDDMNYPLTQILGKLAVVVTSAFAEQGHIIRWRRLAAIEIFALRLYYGTIADSSLSTTSLERLLKHSGVVTTTVLTPFISPNVRIMLLHHLLRASFSRSSLVMVLVERLLHSVDIASNNSMVFVSSKRKNHLARKLWEVLVFTQSSTQQRGHRQISFIASILQVLEQLAGIKADIVRQSVEKTLVPIMIQVANDDEGEGSTRSSISTSEMLHHIMLAIQFEDPRLTTESSTFVNILEESLLSQLRHISNRRTAMVLVHAVYDVFTRVKSPELQIFAQNLVPDCVESILFSDAMPVENTHATFEIELLRQLAPEADESVLADLVPAFLKKLSKTCPNGKVLTTDQLICVLLLMRSRHINSQHGESIDQYVKFFLRCGLLTLQTQSNDPNALQENLFTAIALIIDDLCADQSRRPNISPLLPMFVTAMTTLNNDSTQAYNCFIHFSAILLQLVAKAAVNPMEIAYDFKAHLAFVTGHSCFHEHLVNAKTQMLLLRVVFHLIQLSGVYDRKLYQTLLSVYSMSLSTFDRLLRVVFEVFDQRANISLPQFGFRFGSTASFFAEEADNVECTRSELVNDSMWLISGGLELHRIRETVEHFPLDREVSISDDLGLVSFDFVEKDVVDKQETGSYDPSYLLPMLSHFLSSSDLPDSAIVQQGLLGLVIRATSSNAESIREYAYGIIAHLHESLQYESAEFKPGRQIYLLLDTFRNAIEQPLEPVSSVVTVFMNDTIPILCRPMHVMYPHINHFLLARPAIDVNDVPMFYSLFNSRSSQTYKQERSWLLHTLRRGIREDTDVSLLIRRHVLSILMSFFGSDLADDHTQALIGHILIAALRTPSGGAYLVQKAAVFEWITGQLLLCSSTGKQTAMSSALLLLLIDLVEAGIKASTLLDENDSPLHKSVALQAVNAFRALLTCINVNNVPTTMTLQSKFTGLAELVLRHAHCACTLPVLQEIITVLNLPSPDVESRVIVSCAELIINDKLLQRSDFQKRSFNVWAALLQQIVYALTSVLTASPMARKTVGATVPSVALRQRSKAVLNDLQSLLKQTPTLKGMVLTALREEGTTYAALL